MAMTNLKLSTSEQPILGPELEKPEYPWGLVVTLNQEVLNRLGIGPLPRVGAMVSFRAQAEVVGVSKEDGENGPRHEVRLQITDMDFSQNRDLDTAQIMFGNG